MYRRRLPCFWTFVLRAPCIWQSLRRLRHFTETCTYFLRFSCCARQVCSQLRAARSFSMRLPLVLTLQVVRTTERCTLRAARLAVRHGTASGADHWKVFGVCFARGVQVFWIIWERTSGTHSVFCANAWFDSEYMYLCQSRRLVLSILPHFLM